MIKRPVVSTGVLFAAFLAAAVAWWFTVRPEVNLSLAFQNWVAPLSVLSCALGVWMVHHALPSSDGKEPPFGKHAAYWGYILGLGSALAFTWSWGEGNFNIMNMVRASVGGALVLLALLVFVLFVRVGTATDIQRHSFRRQLELKEADR